VETICRVWILPPTGSKVSWYSTPWPNETAAAAGTKRHAATAAGRERKRNINRMENSLDIDPGNGHTKAEPGGMSYRRAANARLHQPGEAT